jgi:hypothetical protein
MNYFKKLCNRWIVENYPVDTQNIVNPISVVKHSASVQKRTYKHRSLPVRQKLIDHTKTIIHPEMKKMMDDEDFQGKKYSA